MTIQEWLGPDNQLGIDIWEKKYRHNNESFDMWLERVSGGSQELKKKIIEKKFLFGGRTLTNRGTKQGSYNNCYCSGRVPDSLSGILQVAKNIALTFKAQGGQGLSLSAIRPKGAVINDTFVSDGIVPFMEIFNTVTASVSQGGHRRGALMMSLDVEHPQILDFIKIKSDHNKINNANLSVEINNRFMQAVETYYNTGEKVTYVVPNSFKGGNSEGYTICPIDIYKVIMEQAYNNAEPGVMFMNRFQKYNMMQYVPDYNIYTSNPCGEQPLPENGACCLSSINLSEYVLNPFTEQAEFDYASFIEDIDLYVREADKIIDESAELHALPEQKEFALNYRNIGIGIMGLASAFIKMGITYGSDASIEFADKVMKLLFRTAVFSSAKLAQSYGTFPKYSHKMLESEILRNHFSHSELEALKSSGLRNSSLISIAPTGSIGTMLDVSTGIEPWFSSKYMRKTVSLSGEGDKYYEIEVPIFEQAKKLLKNKECLVTSGQIDWQNRIRLQGALQQHVDTAISSTINLKKDISLKEIESLYLFAWKAGLKGVTIFRDGSREGVLVGDKPKDTSDTIKYDAIKPVSRKSLGTTTGSTHCMKCACGTLYITTNFNDSGDLVEVFTHTSKGGICQANMNAVTRMISLGLRSGIKVEEISDQLNAIYCPACQISKAKGKEINGTSCPDIISKVIKKVYRKEPEKQENTSNKQKCPECNAELEFVGGCVQCSVCGYSKCS